MASDAVAAGLYESATKRFNPVESFMAGVQTAHAAKRLALAESGALFDNVLQQQRLQMEMQENQLRAKMADESSKIAWFNAQTNRLNATRPLRASGSSASGGAAPQVPSFGTDEEGNLTISFAQPAPEDAQVPTTGEGDGMEATPLLPAPEGAAPSVLPPLGPAPAPSQMGEPSVPGSTPSGPMATTAPSTGTTKPKAPTLYVTGGSVNTKTGSKTFNWSTTKPGSKDGEAPPIPPEMFESYKRLAATEGMDIGEMTATGNGIKDIKLTPKVGAGDISVSSLPADEQKRWAGQMTELVELAKKAREASNLTGLTSQQIDARKMAAVGKSDPAEMTAEDWQRGYQLITPAGAMQALVTKANEYAAGLNLTFQGKKGYVPRTAESVLMDLGINPPVPPGQTPKPSAPATANASAATPSTTTTAAPGPVSAARKADITKYETVLIPQARAAVAAAKNPQERMYAQNQLASMEDFLGKLKTSTPPTGGTGETSSAIQAPSATPDDPFQAIAASKSANQVAEEKKAPKKEADRELWETNKQAVLKTMVSAGGRDTISDLNKAETGDDQGGGKSRESKWSEWLDAHKDKLPLKTADGKPVKNLYDVLWTDADGRKVTVRDIISAALQDPRTVEALKAPARKEAVQTGGQQLSAEAQSVLKQAGLSN